MDPHFHRHAKGKRALPGRIENQFDKKLEIIIDTRMPIYKGAFIQVLSFGVFLYLCPIFRAGPDRLGQWSDVVSLAVAG
jgi:hypothetical protein